MRIKIKRFIHIVRFCPLVTIILTSNHGISTIQGKKTKKEERKLRKKKEKVTTWNSRHSGQYTLARATWRIDIINCIGEGKTWRHSLGYFLYYENEREGGRRKESEKEKERKEEKERDLLIRSLKENFSESIDQNPPLTSIEFFF